MIPATYEIGLSNCTFHAFHGVLDAEKTLGQRFHVDVMLTVRASAALERDEIRGSVHYGEVFAEVERVVTHTRRDLIEALAFDVARALLERFPAVLSAQIAVRKPSVPIAGVLDHAEVRIRLDRP